MTFVFRKMCVFIFQADILSTAEKPLGKHNAAEGS